MINFTFHISHFTFVAQEVILLKNVKCKMKNATTLGVANG